MQDLSPYSSAAGGAGMNVKQPAFPEQEQLKCPRCDSPNTKFCYYNNYNLSQPRHFCKNCRRYWTKGGALRNIPVGGGSRKNTKKSSSSGSAKRPSSSSSSSAMSASSATSSNTALLNNNNSHGGGVQNIVGPKPDSDPIQMWVSHGSRGGVVMDVNASNGNASVNAAEVSGGFSSLLASNAQFGNLFESMGNNGAGSGLRALEFGEFGENLNLNTGSDTGRASGLELQNGNGPGDGFLALQNGDSTCWNGSGSGWPDLAIYTPGSTYHQ